MPVLSFSESRYPLFKDARLELFRKQPVQEMKSALASTSGFSQISNSPCFDCSICLDSAHEPVVTLCGHLYCWPGIYKWLEFQRSSLSLDESAQCPISKSEISHESVVPLYERGQSTLQPESANKTGLKLILPPRPTSYDLCQRVQSQQTSPNSVPNHEKANRSSLPPDLGSSIPLCHPMCGNYGEMVYAGVFGNSESFSCHTRGSVSPMLRRLEIQTSKSLNRISLFIFCCIMLYLFLFWCLVS